MLHSGGRSDHASMGQSEWQQGFGWAVMRTEVAVGTVGSGTSQLRQQRKLQGTAHSVLRARERRSVAGAACAVEGGEGAHAAFRANVQSDAIRLAADEDRNRLYANVCFTKGGEQVRPEKARPASQQHARPIVVLVINVRSGC